MSKITTVAQLEKAMIEGRVVKVDNLDGFFSVIVDAVKRDGTAIGYDGDERVSINLATDKVFA